MTALPFISIENLQRGMQAFRAQRGWPADFHNSFYQQLQMLTTVPVMLTTWRALIEHLAGWRALRPFSKEQMYLAGLPQLDELNRHLYILDHLPTPSLETIAWSDAAPLFQSAATIKPVSSPVFASKLCHFLRPAIYSVVDQAVLGIGTTTYGAYWQMCQDAWREYPEQDVLVAELRQAIGAEVVGGYPWATKIVELCSIGRKQP